jgi:hypothetical protein
VAFTYSRTGDVQSERLTRSAASDNWRFGRVLSGRQSETNAGISDFDQPYRVVVSGTYTFPWLAWSTDVSLYYLGSSGFPYTYVAGGDPRRGDLNADGTSANDPIYVPRNAADTAEIRFGGAASQVAAQQAAFEQFIDGSSCLRRQRGSIMTRNSCRSPWVDLTNVALRQSVPAMRGHAITLEVEVFNFLNLLSSRWGAIAIPNPVGATLSSQVPVLSQVGQSAGPLSQSQPLFTFDPTLRRFSSQNIDSYYQIQVGARYSF